MLSFPYTTCIACIVAIDRDYFYHRINLVIVSHEKFYDEIFTKIYDRCLHVYYTKLLISDDQVHTNRKTN